MKKPNVTKKRLQLDVEKVRELVAEQFKDIIGGSGSNTGSDRGRCAA
jgi:hypothetical protein